MTLPRGRKRPRQTPDIPPEYVEYQAVFSAPDRGATLMLQNPEPLFADFDDRATAFEVACKQATEKANELHAEGSIHKQQEGEIAAEEMRLEQQLNELKKQRDSHAKQKDGKFAEARHYEGQAEDFKVRAADLRTSIATLQEAHRNSQRAPGTAPMPAQNAVDPAGPTRVDLSDDPRMNGPVRRFNEAHDELPADQRDGEKPL